MTELEFSSLFTKHLRGLWPDWEPSPQEVSLWSETFCRYDERDVRVAINRHKTNSRYRAPRVSEVRKELGSVIRERKIQEQKPQSGDDWLGQAFLVIHKNDAGQIDFYTQPFCVNHRVAEVPEQFIGKRCTQHTDFIKSRFEKRYPGGYWACEVLNDETLPKRLREIKIEMMNPEDQEKAAKVELAILDKKKFKDIHGMIEDLANKKSIAEQKAVLVKTVTDEVPW